MGQRRDEWVERAGLLPELRRQAASQPVALKAQGARLYDVDNVGYLDYLGAGGSAIAGYANQFILDAVRKVLASGVPEGVHVPQEVELAEKLGALVGWPRAWWLCRHQDEAMRRLLMWVAHASERRVVLMLDGGARLRCGSASIGSTARSALRIREVRGWDVERIEAELAARASKVAALVVDPLMSRWGLIAPPDGALARIAEACRRHEILLLFDERVSGFRLDRGGAAALAGVTPDAAVYGGALGGGFPVGVVAFRDPQAGPAPIDDEAPLPPPHPASLAAAEAVLSMLRNDAIYERLEERAAQLIDGILALAERFSRPIVANRVGSAFSLYFSRRPVDSRSGVEGADSAAYARFVDGLLEEGVLLPRHSGTAFVSSAHGAKDVEETLEAVERVLLRLHQEDMP